jgi:hypothetical protein
MSEPAENMESAPAEPIGSSAEPIGSSAEPIGPSIEKFETWEQLENGYRELEAFRGNSVRIPSQEAGPDDWAAFDEQLSKVEGVVRIPDGSDPDALNNFYQRLGAPADPNGYQFDPIEGFNADPEDLGAFAAAAHANHLTREQAQGMFKYLAGGLAESEQEATQALNESMGELQGQWGKAFEHNFQIAQAAAKQLEDRLPGISDHLGSMTTENFNPNDVRLLYEMAQLLGETGAIDAGRAPGIMTPDEAMLQAQEIRDNPDHPYNNELDPAHQSAQRKMADLYKIAYQK